MTDYKRRDNPAPQRAIQSAAYAAVKTRDQRVGFDTLRRSAVYPDAWSESRPGAQPRAVTTESNLPFLFSSKSRFQRNASASGAKHIGGTTQNRTGDQGVAVPRLTAWLWYQICFLLYAAFRDLSIPFYTLKKAGFRQASRQSLRHIIATATATRTQSRPKIKIEVKLPSISSATFRKIAFLLNGYSNRTTGKGGWQFAL